MHPSLMFGRFVMPFVQQALPEAERQTGEAIGNGAGIDDNAAVEAIKAERQHANQVKAVLPYATGFHA